MTNIKSLSNTELLSILIHSKNDNLAQRVTNYLTTISRTPRIKELMRIQGVGWTRAKLVLAAMELSVRYMMATEALIITCPEDLLPLLSWLKYEELEHMVVVTLDSANHVINIHDVTTGLANNTPAHPREIYAKAIADRAVTIIFAHNHPSGSKSLSPEDISITRILCAAGKLLQIPIIDHIIICKSGYTSTCRKHNAIFEKAFCP